MCRRMRCIYSIVQKLRVVSSERIRAMTTACFVLKDGDSISPSSLRRVPDKSNLVCINLTMCGNKHGLPQYL
jgi:hypothetical protein